MAPTEVLTRLYGFFFTDGRPHDVRMRHAQHPLAAAGLSQQHTLQDNPLSVRRPRSLPLLKTTVRHSSNH